MGILAVAAVQIGAGLLLNALFPPPAQNAEGPRLANKEISGSSYGEAWAIPYGVGRTKTNMIWNDDLTEIKLEEDVGGKGGGGGGTVTTYEYFADFAVGVVAGPIDRILQIYMSGKLVYDTTGTGKVTDIYEGVDRTAILRIRQSSGGSTMEQLRAEVIAAGGFLAQIFGADAQLGLPLRFYNGDERQLPDPLIESVEGVGNVSAHRGLAYIVFEKLPVKNFGNGVPDVHVVYATDAPNSIIEQAPTTIGAVPNDQFGFDPRRRRVISIGLSDQTRFSYDDWTQTGLTDVGVPVTSGLIMAVSRSGNYYTIADGGSDRSIERKDPSSFAVTALGPLVTAPAAYLASVYVTALTPEADIVEYVFGGSQAGGVVISQDSPVAGLLSHTPVGLSAKVAGNDFSLAGLVGGPLVPDRVDGIMYHFQNWTSGSDDPTAPLVLWKYEIESVPSVSDDVGTVIIETLLHKFPRNDPVDGFPGAGARIDHAFYVEGDDSLIIQGGGDTIKFDLRTLTILARTSLLPKFGDSMVNSKITGGIFAYASGTAISGSFFEVNSSTLAIIRQTSIDTVEPFSIVDDNFYDEETNAIICNKNGLSKFFVNRAIGNSVPLSTIVLDLCLRAGLATTDVDVTDLASVQVKGFLANPQSSARRHIEALQQAFFFDGVESDGKLVFRLRGKTSIRTIPFDDLGELREDDGLPDPTSGRVNLTRAQEVELPRRVTVSYSDEDRAYQDGAQFNQRISDPEPAMFALSEMKVNLPIVMNATEAKQIAEKWLYNMWLGRNSWASKTHWGHLELDVADIVTLPLPSGNKTVRITRMDIGADLSIEFDFQEENLELYTAISSADDGFGFRDQAILATSLTEPFFLDIPLLDPKDSTANQFSRAYFAMAGYSNNWPGGVMLRSDDGGASFGEVGVSFTEVAWGTLPLAMPNAPNGRHNIFDDTTTVTFFPERGSSQFVSDTDLALLNGANGVLIGKEITQPGTAVLNADGSITLSHFLRGRLGTNIHMATHTVNERVFRLTKAMIASMSLTFAQVGTPIQYKAVTVSHILETADLEIATYTAADQKPYAVVILEGSRSSGDLTVSWRRRTRYNRPQLVGIAPLNEGFERYEIELRANGVLLRTVTVNDATSFLYTLAQWTADSGLASGQYPITNGDFESTDLSAFSFETNFGPTGTVLFQVVSSTGAITGPQAGLTFLRSSNQIFDEVEIKQTGHLVNDWKLTAEEIRLGISYTLEGYTAQPGPDTNDTMELIFEWLNAAGGVLLTHTTGQITQAADDTWVLRQFTGTIPKAARQLRFRFEVISSSGAPLDPANGALDSLKVILGTGVTKVEATVYQMSEPVGRGFAKVGIV